MSREVSATHDFVFDGGRLCLDFANTVSWRGTDRERDWFGHYEDLMDWGRRANLLSKKTADALAREARRDGSGAAGLVEARDLRALIHRVMLKIATSGRPRGKDIAAINAGIASMAPRERLIRKGSGFAWAPGQPDRGVDRLLSPILWSAADLLTDGELDRVSLCAGPGCGGLFYDVSRNRSRRWCSMADCGNRAKAKRHYARHRS